MKCPPVDRYALVFRDPGFGGPCLEINELSSGWQGWLGSKFWRFVDSNDAMVFSHYVAGANAGLNGSKIMEQKLRIFTVDAPKSGVSRVTGKPWEIVEAQAALLDDAGMVSKVGVLMVPKEMRLSLSPGDYVGTFGMTVSFKDRRVEAVLLSLVPVKASGAALPVKA